MLVNESIVLIKVKLQMQRTVALKNKIQHNIRLK